MKAHLLHQDKEFDWRIVLRAMEALENSRRGWSRRDEPYFNPHFGLPWNAEELIADLSLNTLFEAMSQKDDCIYETSKRVILTAISGDIKTIQYRQHVLQDCLDNEEVIRELYALAVKALEKKHGHYISDYTRKHPDSMLRESIEVIDELLETLRKLNRLASTHSGKFKSEGWTAFFAMISRDLDDSYIAQVEYHLSQLKLRHETLLLSAKLGTANKANNYLLHEAPKRDTGLLTRSKALFGHKEPVYSFKLHPRDDAGHQALSELRDRGIGLVAGAVGQSADNVGDFFEMLKVELAFYIGCLNLQKQLAKKDELVCMPVPLAANKLKLSFQALYDVGLSLSVNDRIVSNDINADDKDLIIITGTNTGGKSTFLRSVGIAQLMMQAGMFVPAKTFCSSVCDGLFTHYKREEDTQMESGKFDEELSRMSNMIDHIKPYSMILFNESFSATNEREGSEIARQIITALLDKKIKVLCVTHQYELASGFYDAQKVSTLFLQAGRKSNGTRTFKMIEGKPLPTSFGEDLYKSIFSS